MTEAEVFSLPLNKYMAFRRQKAEKALRIVNYDAACLNLFEAIWLKQYYEYKVANINYGI